MADNYRIQARQAKDRFLTYDQQALIEKCHLDFDDTWLYATMLSSTYRIHRKTGDMERLAEGKWVDGNGFGEVMTLLDLICDSRPDRCLSLRWKNMRDFGLQFHSTFLETTADPWAEKFQADPDGFRRACLALGGRPIPQGDMAFAIELFEGLCIVMQLWFGDEEFPPNLRFLWDENALQYLRYETMYFAKDLLLTRLKTCL